MQHSLRHFAVFMLCYEILECTTYCHINAHKLNDPYYFKLPKEETFTGLNMTWHRTAKNGWNKIPVMSHRHTAINAWMQWNITIQQT